MLEATTSIPFLSKPCTHIPGVGRGVYADGALTDYVLSFAPSRPTLLMAMHCAEENKPIKRNIWDSEWQQHTRACLGPAQHSSQTRQTQQVLPAPQDRA